MKNLKPINFIGKCKGYNTLVDCHFRAFKYEQTADILSEEGYYIPEDQFEMFGKVLDIQVHLDIGV